MADEQQPGGIVSAAAERLRGIPMPALVVIGVLLVVVLVVAVVLLVRRSRAGGAPAPSSLVSVWEAFLAKIPRDARYFPIAVVFGDSLAGKTRLIASRVEWEGQDRQLLRSAPGNKRLPLYLGRGVLVQEISSEVLHEGPAELEALWAPLKDRTPVVVVVLDASKLPTAEKLKSLGEVVRGKINVISAIRGARVEIRVCLSHLDQIEGYSELTALLGDAREHLLITLPEHPTDDDLGRCLEPFEPYLARALTGPSTATFKKVNRFLVTDGPALFRAIAPFVRALLADEPLSLEPLIPGIYLSGLAAKDHVGNPLLVDQNQTAIVAKQEDRRRRAACAWALAAAAALTAGLYGYHRYQIGEADDAVKAFAEAGLIARQPPPSDAATAAAIAKERAAGERLTQVRSWSTALGPILDDSFAANKKDEKARYLSAVRSLHVLPLIDAAQDRYRILHAIALLYAYHGNDLGKLALEDTSSWVDTLGVPESVIVDYVKISDAEDYERISDTEWSARLAALPEDPPTAASTDLGPWLAYLTRLSNAIGRSSISPKELEDLQRNAAPLIAVLDEARRYQGAKRLIAALSREKRVDLGKIGPLLSKREAPAWVNENQVALTALLALVKNGSLSAEPGDHLTLAQLMSQLNAAPASAQADATYAFVLKQKSFSFHTRDWSDLLGRSRGGVLVKAFLDDYRDQSRWSYFASESAYPNVGAGIVPGKGPSRALPGVFTRSAFDKEVSPVLEGFDAALATAPLSPDDKLKLRNQVDAEARRYGQRYSDALRAYYASFRLTAGSAAALQAVISAMMLPGSWFVDFLRTVAENAALEIKDAAYLKPIGEALKGLGPIVALMTEQKGLYPNLDKYLGLLTPLSGAAPAAAPAADKGPGLADLLSPLGKSSLAMMREDKDSVLRQVEGWVDASGLGGFRAPFLAPVNLAYGSGLDEIERTVAQQWRQEILADILPVLTRFPFNPRSDQDASTADVEALFVPVKGRLWAALDRGILPVVVLKNGAYQPWSGALRGPKLPKDMLPTVNALLKTAAALWSADGKPQALALGIKPQVLSRGDADDQIATLSFLKTAKTSVFGFNQTPAWQDVDFTWWDEDTSSVGIQLSKPSESKKRYQSIDVADSAWSFYRLLQQASVSERSVATWTVPGDPVGRTTRQVKFSLRGSPWTPFQVPVSQ